MRITTDQETNSKRRISLSFGVILLLGVSLYLPVVAQYLNRISLSMRTLSILSLALAIFALITGRRYSVSSHSIGLFICFTGWIIISTIAYDNYILISQDTQSLLGFQINGYAAFFPSLWILFFPFILYCGLFEENDFEQKVLGAVLVISLAVNFILLVSAVMIYPDMVRASKTAEALGYGNYVSILINYAETYGLVLIVPAIARKYDDSQAGSRLVALIALIVIILMSIISNFVTAGMLSVIGFLAYKVFKMNKEKRSIILALIIIGVFVLFYFGGQIFVNIANSLGSDSTWGQKFYDIGMSILSSDGIGDVGARSDLYTQSWRSFVQSPFLGSITNGNCVIGCHSTMLDVAGSTGLVGLFLYIGSIVACYRRCKATRYFSYNSADIKASFLVFVLMIFLKNTISSYAIYAMFFGFLPLYYKIWKPNE